MKKNPAPHLVRLAQKGPLAFAKRHGILLAAVIAVSLPLFLAAIASTHTIKDIVNGTPLLLPGNRALETYSRIVTPGATPLGVDAMVLVRNTFFSAVGIAAGKVGLSLLTAYALVFFALPGKQFIFSLLLLTLMLPVEVRIIPTFQVLAQLKLINTWPGLIMPLTVSATAVFLFRQTFVRFPRELVEASQMDGHGPVGFFFHILVPMVRNEIIAMFVIMFIYGWNQYLWPLLVATTDRLYTLQVGINRLLATGDQQADWPLVMAMTMLTIIPPVVLLVVYQLTLAPGGHSEDK